MIIAKFKAGGRAYAVYKYGYADYFVSAPNCHNVFNFETDEEAIRYFAEKCGVPVNQVTNFNKGENKNEYRNNL